MREFSADSLVHRISFFAHPPIAEPPSVIIPPYPWTPVHRPSWRGPRAHLTNVDHTENRERVVLNVGDDESRYDHPRTPRRRGK